MAKRPDPQSRVALVFPRTGAEAAPLKADVKEWIKQGWKPAETAKEAENGNT